uniref:Candidate secreted effector n=1 Tax=Meloidogyne incognita TaxID=6306 RepID=A0A914M8S6_MELIC
MSTKLIKLIQLFLFFVFIIEIVNCGNCGCGGVDVLDDDNDGEDVGAEPNLGGQNQPAVQHFDPNQVNFSLEVPDSGQNDTRN